MTTHKKITLIMTAIFIAVQIGLMLGLVWKGYPEYVRSTGVPTLLFLLYTAAEWKYDFYMNHGVRAIFMTAIFTDGFFGYYLNLYVTSFVFDKMQHVFGSYGWGLFTFILVAQISCRPMGRLFKFILAAALALSIGAIYEILEFIGDSISKSNLPSQPSLLDTDLDLVSDLIGAILAGLQAAFRNLEKK